MANTSARYGKAGNNLATGAASLGNTLKAIFLKSSYTPNYDTHEHVSDLTLASNESSGSVYTSGGETLADVAGVYDADNNNTKYSATDITLDNETLDEVKYIAIVDSTTNHLLTLTTLDPAAAPTGQQFKVVLSDGFLTI